MSGQIAMSFAQMTSLWPRISEGIQKPKTDNQFPKEEIEEISLNAIEHLPKEAYTSTNQSSWYASKKEILVK